MKEKLGTMRDWRWWVIGIATSSITQGTAKHLGAGEILTFVVGLGVTMSVLTGYSYYCWRKENG